MKKPIIVVEIKSLSYTGTSWLNAVLGSHSEAFYLGPAHRLWEQNVENNAALCLIHGEDCPFWSGFFERPDSSDNLFIKIAEYSGKSIIVTNNLTALPQSSLAHKDIVHKQIRLIRDGRALACSYFRKFPEKEFIGAITDFLQPALDHYEWNPDDPNVLALKYEDLLENQPEKIKSIGDFLGQSFSEDHLRFWEYDHHVITANQGVVSFIKMHQGIPMANFEGSSHYKTQFKYIIENSELSFSDDRSKVHISTPQRFLFDVYCGADNERFGYQRDRFTLNDIAKFSSLLATAIHTGEINLGEHSDLLRKKQKESLSFVQSNSTSFLKRTVAANNVIKKENPSPMIFRLIVRSGKLFNLQKIYIFRVFYRKIKSRIL